MSALGESGGTISLHPITLRFPAPLEYSYREEMWPRERRVTRIALVSGLLIWSLFAVVDAGVAPEVWQRVTLLRFSIFPPIAAVAFALTFVRLGPRARNALIAVPLAVAIAVALILAVIAPPDRYFAHVAAVLLILLFGYIFSRAGFVLTTGICLLSLPAYAVVAGTAGELTSVDGMVTLAALAVSNLAGAVSAYNLEHRSRSDFLGRNSLLEDATLKSRLNEWLEQLVEQRTEDLTRLNTALQRENEERKRIEDQLQYLATHDPMTGLANRHFLEEQLEKAVSRGLVNEESLAVLVVDVDNFKTINDRYGHRRADLILREAGARIQDAVRNLDTVARFAGDTFAVLLPKAGNTSTVGMVLDRLHDNFDKPIVLEDLSLEITVSSGAALCPTDANDSAGLLRCADSAMHQAKSAGRDRYQFFSRELDVLLARRDSLERRLRTAIDRSELHLVLQPKFDLQEGKRSGFESLLRWTAGREAVSAPNEFIPIAEESGVISPIGKWVLKETCTLAQQYARNLSVNVSPVQLSEAGLTPYIIDVLSRCDTEPSLLTLEITESALMSDVADARALLTAIRSAGIRISIDDFGTGYSSLAYLSRLPIDEVKIDKSFVQQIGRSAPDEAIVKAIIGLAHNIGARVVGEGVELAEQAAFLKAEGCDEVQGFLYARPLAPADAINAPLPPSLKPQV